MASHCMGESTEDLVAGLKYLASLVRQASLAH